jgi:hypothetical protein
MQIGMAGPGKMGGNMSLRLTQGGHKVVGATDLHRFVEQPEKPRVARLMVREADPTESMVNAGRMAPGTS